MIRQGSKRVMKMLQGRLLVSVALLRIGKTPTFDARPQGNYIKAPGMPAAWRNFQLPHFLLQDVGHIMFGVV